MVDLNKDNFDEHIKSGLALVDFWAPWCGPCQMLKPVIDELAKEMTDVKIGKLNIDENEELAQKFSVMSIPTLMLFKDGQKIDQKMGASSKASIKEWIESHK
jgi:thioredoxin 1